MGKIMAGYVLIPKDKAHLVPYEELYPNHTKEVLNLFCIGVRDIE